MHSPNDKSLDPEWQAEQTDRLLGFEILTRTLTARYQPISPQDLSEKIAANKNYSYSILQSIRRKINEHR
jgi:hypothetical protein